MNDSDISVREIARLLNAQAETLCAVLLPNGIKAGGYWNVGSVRGEAGSTLKVTLNGSKRGGWSDFACSRGDPEGNGDMLRLVQLTVADGDMGRAVKWAKGWLGIESMDPDKLQRHLKRAEAAQARAEARAADDAEKRRRIAVGLWHHASPIAGTPAESYLRGRGIDFAGLGRLPRAIRFRHDVWHAETQSKLPAMVTMGMTPDGTHRTTHAVFLHRLPGGGWTKLPNGTDADGKTIKWAKKTFGPVTSGQHYPIHKGASGLPMKDMPAGEPLHVAEGIEDALTFAMIRPEARVVYAGTLGAIGTLIVPPQCGDFIILAQRDPPGSQAEASFEAQIAAQQQRAIADGSNRRVMCLWPGEGFKDWNDELRGVRM